MVQHARTDLVSSSSWPSISAGHFAFFTAQSPLLGLIEIVPFWLSIAVTMVLFWRLDRWAGLMFVPRYICWVSFVRR
jgi:tryptophan-rich sensory protein